MWGGHSPEGRKAPVLLTPNAPKQCRQAKPAARRGCPTAACATTSATHMEWQAAMLPLGPRAPLGSGQSRTWWRGCLQLKHLESSVQSARTWSVAKQLKHLPTRSAGTGHATSAAALLQRRRLWTSLNLSSSGSADMRAGCTTMDASLRGGGESGRAFSQRASAMNPAAAPGLPSRKAHCLPATRRWGAVGLAEGLLRVGEAQPLTWRPQEGFRPRVK